MLGLLFQVGRLVRAVVAIAATPQGRALLVLVVAQLVAGTLFYTFTEGWRVLDALYFCVMVLTTIGLGDIAPQTDLGKVFTMVYALAGIGLIAALVTVVATHLRGRPRAGSADPVDD